jgi:hypothetical protein
MFLTHHFDCFKRSVQVLLLIYKNFDLKMSDTEFDFSDGADGGCCDCSGSIDGGKITKTKAPCRISKSSVSQLIR